MPPQTPLLLCHSASEHRFLTALLKLFYACERASVRFFQCAAVCFPGRGLAVPMLFLRNGAGAADLRAECGGKLFCGRDVVGGGKTTADADNALRGSEVHGGGFYRARAGKLDRAVSGAVYLRDLRLRGSV